MQTPRELDDLGTVIDELLPEPPALLGLGEPTHGIKAFPLLRNELLVHLVERGFRSIALETDFFAASLVNDYVTGSSTDIDTVLATGFSHGFGNVPGNHELVEWLRAHNADRAPEDRVRFYGFDAPTEFAAAPSPRRWLSAVNDYLGLGTDIDAGDDADWSNPNAMYDATKSIGNSSRAQALRVVADDLASALRRAAPDAEDPAAYDHIVAHARTALGLLRYHATMANEAPDRIGALLGIRAEMMADNLLDIVAREQDRGPTFVFAHNAHLRRTNASAGALVAVTLGSRYVVVTSDANPHSEPCTLQHALASKTIRRALFKDLPTGLKAGEPILPGHLPLTPEDVQGSDAVIFVADTDGQRHQYW